MNFTREPIIETIITPKEGYKLVVRNSKGSGGEEYIVDAIEVVSFGHSFFFRSLERPKSFLVPVSDYEIVEAKETRVVLKNASFERSIKIGGGREAGKAAKEKVIPVIPIVEPEIQEPAAIEQRLEKKRERRRHRRRRSPGAEETEHSKPAEEKATEGGGADDETRVSSSMISRLIPPPSRLISDKFAQERAQASAASEVPVLPKTVDDSSFEEKFTETFFEEEFKNEPNTDIEGGEMHRVSNEMNEAFSSTSFSTLEDTSHFSSFGKIW